MTTHVQVHVQVHQPETIKEPELQQVRILVYRHVQARERVRILVQELQRARILVPHRERVRILATVLLGWLIPESELLRLVTQEL